MKYQTPGRFARRDFVKICSGMAIAAAARPERLMAREEPRREYNRVRLMHWDARPLEAADLSTGTSYIFGYPFAETPCFLLNLGQSITSTSDLATATGSSYRSVDGIGADGSIVAFSAICTHKLSHPAKAISFIDYRDDTTSYVDQDSNKVSQSKIIFCCSERSAYDPTAGGRVLGGPATEPLTSIILETDPSDDSIYATGTIGGDIFDRFFSTFGPRLSLEYGSDAYLDPIVGDTTIATIDDYTTSTKTC